MPKNKLSPYISRFSFIKCAMSRYDAGWPDWLACLIGSYTGSTRMPFAFLKPTAVENGCHFCGCMSLVGGMQFDLPPFPSKFS
eukprot:1155830-Pelagomonas_calceolata.AAC.2